MITYKKVTPKKPKPRAVRREVTDSDIEAALRLTEKWGAKLTITRGGSVIVKGGQSHG